jgi:hypothetical protein
MCPAASRSTCSSLIITPRATSDVYRSSQAQGMAHPDPGSPESLRLSWTARGCDHHPKVTLPLVNL